MSEKTFDVLSGPATHADKAAGLSGNKKPVRGIVTFVLLILAGLGVGIWLTLTYPIYIWVTWVGFLLYIPIAAMIAKYVNTRAKRKQSWMESEIETAWFKSLNENPVTSDDVDWDIWETAFQKSETISDYDRGYKDGYSRGYADGSA